MRKISLVLPAVATLLLLTAFSCNGKTATNTTVDTSTQPTGTENTGGITGDTNVDVNLPTGKTVKVTYTASGFSPATLTINKGDTVEFINNSSGDFWPASGPHPTHTILPAFDPRRAIAAGGTYEFRFTTSGTFPFHNHLNSSQGGTITVK